MADISVWFARLAPGSTTWTDPVRLSQDPARSEQNPTAARFPVPQGPRDQVVRRPRHQRRDDQRRRGRHLARTAGARLHGPGPHERPPAAGRLAAHPPARRGRPR
ncbi:hypothetical protein [Streptomyces sp. UG1]|uniref:hypothetical protein n=1 Tax=Streptomyces sp. UG1 TaxID=3417652 RepID=UPI003CF3C857